MRTNEVLGERETSHTQYYRPNEPAYWGIAAIFGDYLEMGAIVYDGIGVDVDNQQFIRSVYAGGPAAIAGLKRGDRILLADGQSLEPIASFKGRTGSSVTLKKRGFDPQWRKPLVVLINSR